MPSTEQATRNLNPAVRKARLVRVSQGAQQLVFWALTAYLLLALLGYHPNDPGWSHSGATGEVQNSMGRLGAWLADMILWLSGYPGYLSWLVFAWVAWSLHTSGYRPFAHLPGFSMRLFGLLLFFAGACALGDVYLETGRLLPPKVGGGGILGQIMESSLHGALGTNGYALVMFTLMLTGLTLYVGIRWLELMDMTGRLAWHWGRALRHWGRLVADRAVRLNQRYEQSLRAGPERVYRRQTDVQPGVERPRSDTQENAADSDVTQAPTDLSGLHADPVDAATEQTELPDATARLPADPVAPAKTTQDDATWPISGEQRLPGPGETVTSTPGGEERPSLLGHPMPGPGAPLGQQPATGEPDTGERTAPVSTTQPATGWGSAATESSAGGDIMGQTGGTDDPAFTDVQADHEVDITATEPLPGPAAEAGLSIFPGLSPDSDNLEKAATPAESDPDQAALAATPASPDDAAEPVAGDVAAAAQVTPPAHPPVPPSATATAEAVQEPRIAEAPEPPAPPLYEPPGLELLDAPAGALGQASTERMQTLSGEVETRLADFGIKAEVVDVQPGPVVTRYELQPAPGVKGSQVTNLSKDLARSLSVTGVRVVEVIPGKSVIGLEIPNHQRETVSLSEILASTEFRTSASPLTLALGKDISGRPQVMDLARMPHLLVAGTTGSGKSVALNAMILSLLYRCTPRLARLILIDPKMLELSVYEGIPHLLAPVVTDMKLAANALRWCVGEMERRYQLMAALGVRNLEGYHKRLKQARHEGQALRDPLWQPAGGGTEEVAPELDDMPYIVVVIDELADLMMITGKKVEELIARLAQKARAAGIHLVLATQRPSVDVITGLIKANIPSRIAFQVSAKVDSRTVLDQMGAETLLGHGDMLFLPPGSSVPVRVHGAFVGDEEVRRVAEQLRAQGTQPDYREDLLLDPREYGAPPVPGIEDEEDADALYEEAVQIVTESRRASISYVQRRLKIGYNRAARLIEQMERAGVVGPQEASGNRDVLVPSPEPPPT